MRRLWRRGVRGRKVCLWGWHRRELGYVRVPAEEAYRRQLVIAGTADLARDWVTVFGNR